MALPKELQDLVDFIDEQEPFEGNNPNLSPHLLVEISLKWLDVAVERAKDNPRLINFPDETGRKLCVLAEKFYALKK
jgi:hypothetical protein